MNLKKLVISVTIGLVTVFLGIYLFIPSIINISSVGYLNNDSKVCAENLLVESNWEKWWPDKNNNDSNFVFQNTRYAIIESSAYTASIDLYIENKKSIGTTITIVAYKLDSTGFEWKCKLNPGNNPISRLEYYFLAEEIKKNMESLMKTYADYVGVKKK